jgi:hypothetical protein
MFIDELRWLHTEENCVSPELLFSNFSTGGAILTDGASLYPRPREVWADKLLRTPREARRGVYSHGGRKNMRNAEASFITTGGTP